MMSRKQKNHFRVTVRGDRGVAGEGRVVGVPKFYSWGKYTMPLTQIGCPMLPLACLLFILCGSFHILGCNNIYLLHNETCSTSKVQYVK